MNSAPLTNSVPNLQAEHCLTQTTLRLLAYCQNNGWAGYDPYDALNSELLQKSGLMHFRAARLMVTQLLKRSPINFRPVLRVPPSPNPKGIALFLSALVRLARMELAPLDVVDSLVSTLLSLRSPDARHWCWGYPFPWQSRAALFPRWIPNVICTTFSGNALLDAYEELGNPECLKAALSAADFLLEDLYYEEPGSVACFSYMPLARSKVHNANLLGAAFLCRVAQVSGQQKFLAPAMKAARFTVAHQHPDGSWDYGESDHPPQRWKDNFHTGFNLNALLILARTTGADEFESSAKRGFKFFREHFFAADGMPRYFHNRTYPLDIHSAAQGIITLVSFKNIDGQSLGLAQTVCDWTLRNMLAPEGFFYFQKHRFYTNRIPYMRWSQAWMLLALAALLESKKLCPKSRNVPAQPAEATAQ